MGKETCRSCRYKKESKEWCEIVGCDIATSIKNEALIILGKKGNCPYYEQQEGWGWR